MQRQRDAGRVYTTSGVLSGSCPHQHTTRKQAEDCIRKSGTSDRHTYACDPKGANDPHWVGARKKGLTAKEIAASLQQQALQNNAKPSLWTSVFASVENFRYAVQDVRHQTAVRIAVGMVELWTHAVSPAIHLPARKLLKALKAAGFGK